MKGEREKRGKKVKVKKVEVYDVETKTIELIFKVQLYLLV